MRGEVGIRKGKDSSLQVLMGRGWNEWRLRHADKEQETF